MKLSWEKKVYQELASAEQEQFARTVEEHQGLVFRTLARLVGRTYRLDDLAQEVFLRLWRGLPHFRGEAQTKTYLYRIIVNVAKDEWKRRKRAEIELPLDDPGGGWENRLHSADPNAADVLALATLKSEVDAALNELSSNERNALVLYHQEELSYQEVADALGVPINTVRTYLHRGRERLRQAIRERMGEARDELR